MELHTISAAKPTAPSEFRLALTFDDGNATVDLAPLLAQGGEFEPLRDWQRFASVAVGQDGRTIFWEVGDDVVDLCADSLWLQAHHTGASWVSLP